MKRVCIDMAERDPKLVVAVGNINFDIIFKLHRMPNLDENIRSTETWSGLGGSAANYSIATRRMGRPVVLYARAGRDSEKLGLITRLLEEGVDISGVFIDEEMDTGKVVILILMDTDSRVLITYRGANDRLSADDVECREDAKLYHFASVDPELAMQFIEKCKGKLYSYDPGGWVHVRPYAILDLMDHLHILHVNRAEAHYLNKRTGVELTDFTRTRGRPFITTVKRGREGAYLYWGRRVFSGYLKPGVSVVDTTGAGDAFDAVFNGVYLDTGDPVRALRHAIAAGTVKVTRLGSSSMPRPEEISRLAPLVAVSRIDLLGLDNGNT